MRRVKLSAVVAIILVASIGGLAAAWYIGQLRKENQRLRSNNHVLELGARELLYQDSLNAVKIGMLELERQEIRDYYDSEVMANLRAMDVKLRKLESFTAVNTETVYNIHTSFRDSLVRDTVRLEALNYHSRWIDINIIKSGSEAKLSAVSRDSLIQVVTWERSKKFLLFPCGRKRYEQTIRSANPDSRITYAKYIVPKKRKRLGG
jgi:hypothetical protein